MEEHVVDNQLRFFHLLSYVSTSFSFEVIA